MTYETFSQEIARSFTQSSVTAKLLYTAITTNRNLLLHGPGGYGKSEIVSKALELLKKTSRIIPCDAYMDPSVFTGATDIIALRDRGVISKTTNGVVFLEEGVVVMEEGLDAPPAALLSLRDTLQRRYFCCNGVCHAIGTTSVIICTNVNPLKWASDESRRATLNRFQLNLKVEWTSHEAADYEEMLTLRGFSSSISKTVSQLVVAGNSAGKAINPRTAVSIASLFQDCGIDIEIVENCDSITSSAFAAMKEKWDEVKVRSLADEILESTSLEALTRAELRLQQIPLTMTSPLWEVAEELKKVIQVKKMAVLLPTPITL